MTTTPIKVSRVPSQFDEGACEWLRVMQVRGISTFHEVWVDERTDDHYYMVFPESGPYEALKRWASSPQDCMFWKGTNRPLGDVASRQEAWRSASEYCLAQANEEIEQGMS